MIAQNHIDIVVNRLKNIMVGHFAYKKRTFKKQFCECSFCSSLDIQIQSQIQPEMYRSAGTPFKTELPDPGQTANDLITEFNEPCTAIPT